MPAVWRPAPESTEAPERERSEDAPLQFSRPLTLAAVPTAVSAARRYTRSELRSRGLQALVDDAELVTSELVTNAVTATGYMAPAPTWPELAGLAVIRVRLGFTAMSVIVEVWDCQASRPAQQEPGADAEGGRGLLIVANLCSRWDALEVNGGKVVWGELPLPAPDELPRRMPKRRPAIACPMV
jgi:anti-sigma regulatory factor (Ser/Thr protein kinase)